MVVDGKDLAATGRPRLCKISLWGKTETAATGKTCSICKHVTRRTPPSLPAIRPIRRTAAAPCLRSLPHVRQRCAAGLGTLDGAARDYATFYGVPPRGPPGRSSAGSPVLRSGRRRRFPKINVGGAHTAADARFCRGRMGHRTRPVDLAIRPSTPMRNALMLDATASAACGHRV